MIHRLECSLSSAYSFEYSEVIYKDTVFKIDLNVFLDTFILQLLYFAIKRGVVTDVSAETL